MIKGILIYVIAWICWFGNHLAAQDLNKTYELGVLAIENQEYKEAISLLQRVLFFDSLYAYKNQIYPLLAESYFSLSDWGQAAFYYDLAYYASQDDALLNELVFKKTVALIKSKDFGGALRELYNAYPETESEKNQYTFLQATAEFGMYNYEQANALFQEVLINPQDTALLNSYFEIIEKAESKSEKRARFYSYLFPGLGQLYAKDRKAAINSALLNAAFVGLYLVVAVNFSFIDATVSVGPWFYRYYSGGVINAENALNKHKAKVKSQNYDRILKLVAID